MQRDRRASPRHPVHGFAKVRIQSGVLPRDCRITDLSDGGARLYSEAPLPDRFTLLLGAHMEHARDCQVVWRLGYELGVSFTDAPAAGFARRLAS